MMIENDEGKVLTIKDGRIVISHKDNPSNLVFVVKNQKQMEDIAEFFTNYDLQTRMAQWLEAEKKEVVMEEDLKTMLEAVKFAVIDCNKRANAAGEAANRLSEVYETYTKEKDNENRAKSN